MKRVLVHLFHALSVVAAVLVLTGGTVHAQTPPPADQPTKAVAQPPAAAPGDKPAAGSTTAAPPSTSDNGATMDGSTYAVRLRDLEERIDELKEQIRRSHTRLSLLSDTILGGGVGGSRAEIVFENNMSGAFRLSRAVFVLDGAVQYNKADDTGALAEQPTLPIYAGSIPPGDHTLQVLLELRGHGYGVFSYLRGYRFEVRSSHSFTAAEGKTIQLRAIAYEKGGVTTPLEERPAIRYVQKATSIEATPAAGTSGAPPAASVGVSIGGK